MPSKNIEKTIIERIISDLQGIDGTGSYNYNISDNYIYSSFKYISDVGGFPAICLGDVSIGTSVQVRRNYYEFPITVEIWGYVKDGTNPLSEAFKLFSDIRNALTGDETLNSNVFNMSFTAQIGAEDVLGVVLFTLNITASSER